MKTFLSSLFLLFIVIKDFSCKKPYRPDYSNVKGEVIGKEDCNTDASKDYWLIELHFTGPHYGDSLFLNGMYYTNVIKTKGLPDQVKQAGKRVSIDYKVITSNKISTSDCNVLNPVTYDLKEIFVINLFEIR